MSRSTIMVESGRVTDIVTLGKATMRGMIDRLGTLSIPDDCDSIEIELKPSDVLGNDDTKNLPEWLRIVMLLYDMGAPIAIDVSKCVDGNFSISQSDVVLCDGWNRVELDRDILTGSYFYVFRRCGVSHILKGKGGQ